MNFLLRIFLIITTFFTSSCFLIFDPTPSSWDWGVKPRPMTGMRNFPDANTQYGRGFKDGCQAGLDSVGTGLVGDLNSKYDYKRSQKEADYDSGWWDGFEQCVYITDWDIF